MNVMKEDSAISIYEKEVFDLQVVLDNARVEAGLDDSGEESFVEGLQKLLECASSEVRFTSAGLMNFSATNQRMLINRLRYQRDVTPHPEILQEDVSDPIVILGMPRTGTTKLQRMLSADPGNLALYFWRALNPAPMPGEEPRESGRRIAFARSIEEAQHTQNADMLASHEHSPEEAEEDSFLLLMQFDYIMQAIINPSSTFYAWVRDRSRDNAYSFEKSQLQYLQWQDGGKRGRRWVLKNPGHVGALETLHKTFPNATFVHLHRDLTEVLPSYCRLIESLHAPIIEHVNPVKIGEDSLEYWRHEMARYAEQRSVLADAVEVIDISFSEVVGNAMSVTETIYRRAGITLTDTAGRAMSQWEARNTEQGKGRQSNYSLGRYGLTVQRIRNTLGEFS